MWPPAGCAAAGACRGVRPGGDRGRTHRDEVEVNLNGLPARGYASHGSWSLALALRLAGYEVLRDVGAGEPVLILDDVFAELDQQRRSRLAHFAAQAPVR